MITLDIAIATHKPAGIQRLAQAQLPQIPGVRYVVSWQCHEDAPVPEKLQREDIEIHRFEGTGLSNNRNYNIAVCTADVIMISDDDVKLLPDGVKALIRTYEEHPEIDFISFKSIHESGVTYPSAPCRLYSRLPKNYFVISFETSFRRDTRLKFCPELGLNAPRMHCGEEEMLLQSAIRRGLNCWFFPITVCEHDHPSTGSKAHYTAEDLRAMGCVIAITYGWQALLRVPLKAWRVRRAGQSGFLRAMYYLTQGALESRRVLRRNPDSLW